MKPYTPKTTVRISPAQWGPRRIGDKCTYMGGIYILVDIKITLFGKEAGFNIVCAGGGDGSSEYVFSIRDTAWPNGNESLKWISKRGQIKNWSLKP